MPVEEEDPSYVYVYVLANTEGKNMNILGERLKPAGGHCPECEREVRPIRPPFSVDRRVLWAVLLIAPLFLLATIVLFGGIASWTIVGLLLWRNCRAICPDCGRDPIQGSVGWTRESVVLWTVLAGCTASSLWVTVYFVWLLIWIFTMIFK